MTLHKPISSAWVGLVLLGFAWAALFTGAATASGDDENALLFKKGMAAARNGDNDQEIADANQVIQLDPKNALAFSVRGLGYLKKGDYSHAMADYNHAIQLDTKLEQA